VRLASRMLTPPHQAPPPFQASSPNGSRRGSTRARSEGLRAAPVSRSSSQTDQDHHEGEGLRHGRVTSLSSDILTLIHGSYHGPWHG
jgi:hypothetical protein